MIFSPSSSCFLSSFPPPPFPPPPARSPPHLVHHAGVGRLPVAPRGPPLAEAHGVAPVAVREARVEASLRRRCDAGALADLLRCDPEGGEAAGGHADGGDGARGGDEEQGGGDGEGGAAAVVVGVGGHDDFSFFLGEKST